MKANMVYYSMTGHTEEMAEIVKEALESKGYEVNVYTDSVDGAEFADADVLVFGSPATGVEEVEESVVMSTIDSIPSFEGKKVFMFGSYGWGGGEFMETWKESMESKGAELAAEPVTCLEGPDDAAKDEIKSAIDSL